MSGATTVVRKGTRLVQWKHATDRSQIPSSKEEEMAENRKKDDMENIIAYFRVQNQIYFIDKVLSNMSSYT